MSASLDYLLQRYSDKTCTEQEREELMQLLQLEENDEAAKQAIDRMIRERKPQYFMPEEAADSVLSAILQTSKAPVVSMNDGNKPKHYLWRRMAVAASILLVLASGTWLYLSRTASTDIAKTEVSNRPADLLPGGNKALLTLDDGRTIILDSAANGIVAQQGGASISKTENGQLAYKTADAESVTVLYNTLSTPRGGQYQVVLPDGSKVWLNSASSLRYPTAFTGKERRIEIKGEAYFEVAKNASTPFIVNVEGKAEVQVLGTHFNINSYADEPAIATTLLEGSVRVTGLQTKETKLISPGQQARLNANGQLSLGKNVDVAQVMAWKNGIFNFENADLPTVLRQLSRWYDVDVVYEAAVPQREFGGKMQRDLKLSQILRILEKNGVHYRVEGKKLIITK